MTLRSRMMIAFAYLLLLAIVSLSIPLGFVVARHARSNFAVRLTHRAERVAVRVPDALDAGGRDLLRLVRRNRQNGRVIVVDAKGRLIGESGDQSRLGTDYTYRPEIVNALAGRPTRLVRDYPQAGLQYLVAVPVTDDGRIIGAVRVNQAVALLDARVRRQLLYVGGVSLAILVVGLIVAGLLARSLTKPLRRLADVAGDIGDGQLDARAPPTAQPEVAEVAGALNAMSARIQQAMTAQTDFVANASHQLRTPLTGLRLRLEALQSQGAPGAAEALAETDRLAGLIDDLLVLVRAGTAPLGTESTDLSAAAAEAVDRWSVLAAERDHVLGLEGADDPLHVAASPSDLAIILDNLIENAMKYTPAGTTVCVALERPDEAAADNSAHAQVVLEVSDDGPGIAAQDQPRAFERFYRGTTGTSAPGTGLGLAIVRQIAERWGGEAELLTDGGTRFRIYLSPANPPSDDVESQPAGVTSSVR